MKVLCIFLTLDRLDLTLQCIKQNFYNAEVDADVMLVDNGSTHDNLWRITNAYSFCKIVAFPENLGISHAINAGIKAAAGYDAIVTLANDILMPRGWLNAMIEHAQRIPDSGMIGIHCVEKLPPISDLNIHPAPCAAYGNVMIPRKALDAVGYFNIAYDPYCTQDDDYGYRLIKSGFINYYLPNLRSEHIGHDVGSGTQYRAMKDASLERNWKLLEKNKQMYDDYQNYYIAG
jgi:GT2 family glycosyltransferase